MIKRYYIIANKDNEGFHVPANDPPLLFSTKEQADEILDSLKKEKQKHIDTNVYVRRTMFKKTQHHHFSKDVINSMKWFIHNAFVKTVTVTI